MRDILIRQVFQLARKAYGRIDRLRRQYWEERTIDAFGAFGKGSRVFPYSTFVAPSRIVIGANVHIRGNAYFQGAGELVLGDNVFISRNCTIFTATHNYQGELIPIDEKNIFKPVHIKENVWIGMNVTIIPGVTIGEGAIIGLGTVVTRDVPPLAIVGSMGEKILKYRDREHYERLVSQGRFCGWQGVPLDG